MSHRGFSAVDQYMVGKVREASYILLLQARGNMVQVGRRNEQGLMSCFPPIPTAPPTLASQAPGLEDRNPASLARRHPGMAVSIQKHNRAIGADMILRMVHGYRELNEVKVSLLCQSFLVTGLFHGYVHSSSMHAISACRATLKNLTLADLVVCMRLLALHMTELGTCAYCHVVPYGLCVWDV